MNAVRSQAHDPIAMQAAILFHDCIYDPERADNEQRSADVARNVLQKLHAGPQLVERVCEMILATRHDHMPASDDARLIVDIDLTPLGKPQEEFDENGRAIRREFANVDEENYGAGRAELLKRFLQRPQLYFTEVFRRRYEAPA